MTETTPYPQVSAEKPRVMRRRLARLNDIATADRLRREGHSDGEIAGTLNVSAGAVVRMLGVADDRAGRDDPQAAIYRAVLELTDRDELVEQLSTMTYTFTEYAPYPFDGSKPGTWMKVVGAYGDGLLTEEEFARVADAVGPPQRPPALPTRRSPGTAARVGDI